MRAWLGLLLLIFLYISFAFTQGWAYDAVQGALDWLGHEQGWGYQYLGWVWLITMICGYLFYADRRDKRRERQLLEALKVNIIRHGVLARKSIRNELGPVYLEAGINFMDAGYIFQVRQLSPGSNQKVVLSTNKYVTWDDLLKAIKDNGKFACQDFVVSSQPAAGTRPVQ